MKINSIKVSMMLLTIALTASAAMEQDGASQVQQCRPLELRQTAIAHDHIFSAVYNHLDNLMIIQVFNRLGSQIFKTSFPAAQLTPEWELHAKPVDIKGLLQVSAESCFMFATRSSEKLKKFIILKIILGQGVCEPAWLNSDFVYHGELLRLKNPVITETDNIKLTLDELQNDVIVEQKISFNIHDDTLLTSASIGNIFKLVKLKPEQANYCHPESPHQCSICLNNVSWYSAYRRVLECGHVFHDGCIDPWITQGKTCPICRK